MKSLYTAICLAVLLMSASCSSPKKVPYVVDAETIPFEILSQVPSAMDPVLQAGDLLNIDVTAADPVSVASFNKGMYVNADGTISRMDRSNAGGGSNQDTSTEYYLVDSDGNIVFPIIGTIHVAGLTKSQLATKIAEAICPKYVKVRPDVDVRLMNFRVVMLGAVNGPGVIRSNSDRLNILEAIAMAGDLNIQGKRDDILLYRINPDGTRETHRLDIHDKSILLSPYFNLQQNDIIYVVPNKSMANRSWNLSPAVTTTFTLVGGISSIIALVVTLVNL